jgi:hypothetical protein
MLLNMPSARGLTPEHCRGCTREGFDRWLCIGSPDSEVVVVDLSFLD